MRLKVEQAKQIAQVIVSALEAELQADLVIVDPIRFDTGWIFCHDSEEYLRTGNFRAALGGNAPIAVFESGRVEMLSSEASVQVHLKALNGPK